MTLEEDLKRLSELAAIEQPNKSHQAEMLAIGLRLLGTFVRDIHRIADALTLPGPANG